ncbi:MAG: hypothetical protein CME88_13175 [Hirschia sp.]|nr:hypothetical protein [Hirschia sp.]MBF19321.1 hypothetical protein [Hirschia sp.]
MRILIVSQDMAFAPSLKEVLRSGGDKVDLVSPGMGAVNLGLCGEYGLAFLDDFLAETPALDILERWRREDVALPVIVLASDDNWRFVSASLDMGADQVISRPFELSYCNAMLRATLRRSCWTADAVA